MNKLNLSIGTYAKVFAENTDEALVEWQTHKSLYETKAACTAQKQH